MPIIDPHPRATVSQDFSYLNSPPPKPVPQLSPAQRIHYRERSSVERVFSRLKTEFGGTYIRVRGAAKVMAHLSFALIALTVDQFIKLTG